MNRHCQCALIVGPVVERRGRCGRKECGGLESEVGGVVTGQEWRSESEGRENGLAVETEAIEGAQEKNDKAGM